MDKHFLLQQIDSAAVTEFRELLANASGGMSFVISCRGGDVNCGFEIIEAIESSPVTVSGIVRREAGSAAAIILQACHDRVMENGSTLHYHYASWRVSLLIYFDKQLMKRNRQSGIAMQERLIEPIVKRTGMTRQDVHKLLLEDRHIGAQEALDRGLVDRIVPS